jgi:hypothetical protein
LSEITIGGYAAETILHNIDAIYKKIVGGDYAEYADSIEEDAGYILREIGDIVFDAVIDGDRLAEIDAIRNPAEAPLPPVPVPSNDGECVRYCIRCERPTIFRPDDEWPDKSHLACTVCGKTILVIPATKKGDIDEQS